MPGQLPELRCDTGEIARGQLRSEKKAGAGPLGWWWGQQWCGSGHQGEWSKGNIINGREYSGILSKREDSRGFVKDKKFKKR